MKPPLVSVCLPNLNTRAYLPERVDSIRRQTYPHWELIVSDNYSEDGAWEFFQALAERDGRVSIEQAPREGMYANWNRCIRRARGEFIYIATSDDTMAPDCLEKLVDALCRHPECDIAHCPLKKIDEHGFEMPSRWSDASIFALSSGPLLHTMHIRKAPFDGLLHLLGGTVYVSITQLLIRRSLFDRIGLFESTWGSVGDFNWDMRAGLVANTIHVPHTWGGWRVHATQATANVRFGTTQHARQIDGMIAHAIAASAGNLQPDIRQRLTARWLREAEAMRAFRRKVAAHSHQSAAKRAAFLARALVSGSAPARTYLGSRILGRSPVDWVRRRLSEAGLEPLVLAGQT